MLDWPSESGVLDELLQNIETRRKKHRRRRRSVASGAVSVVALLFIAFWVVPFARNTATVTTPVAHRQTLALADGSQVELNAQTNLYTDFRYGRRVVRLDHGEAFFAVAKDARHPFLVETPSGTVRVTGTHFNVRIANDHHAVVTLIEGSVLVQRGTPEPVKLEPGQQFDSARTGARALSPTELENVVAWRQGRLAFDGLTLLEAAARLSEFHGVDISVAPAIANLRPGGSFPLADLPAVLQALESALAVRVMTNADGSYRIVAR